MIVAHSCQRMMRIATDEQDWLVLYIAEALSSLAWREAGRDSWYARCSVEFKAVGVITLSRFGSGSDWRRVTVNAYVRVAEEVTPGLFKSKAGSQRTGSGIRSLVINCTCTIWWKIHLNYNSYGLSCTRGRVKLS